jgi:hypothetical protein
VNLDIIIVQVVTHVMQLVLLVLLVVVMLVSLVLTEGIFPEQLVLYVMQLV